MSLVESGAEQLIGQFGVTVKVFEQSGDTPEDSDNPVFFDDTDNDTNFTEEKVRLYTSASEEIMKDYGLDDTSDAVMYSTEDIASQEDKVKYDPGGYTWIISEKMTNQIDDDGPYIFIYTMEAL